MKLKWGSQSITGNYREHNEDRCFVDPDGRFFLVADGMGGQSAGEKASELAIEIVARKLAQSSAVASGNREDVINSIDKAVSDANIEIISLGEVEPDYHNMGTTIAFVVCSKSQFYIGNVGDSRVYLQRGESLTQLTTDHSLVQALVDAGTITSDEAKTHRYRNILYRYLGTRDGGTGTTPQVSSPQPGDRLLICSDGVTDGLATEDISRQMAQHSDPQVAAESIVQAALDGGSKDNITAVVIHVG